MKVGKTVWREPLMASKDQRNVQGETSLEPRCGVRGKLSRAAASATPSQVSH